jgi:hypothetical protein
MSNCKIHQGSFFSDGYGQVWFRGNNWRAHRVAWTKANGEIPDGLWVLHKCDNPACINVDHLFLGTAKDNADDRWAKGRKYVNITEAEASAIYSAAHTGREHTQEAKDKIGNALKGKKFSDDHRMKLAEAARLRNRTSKRDKWGQYE